VLSKFLRGLLGMLGIIRKTKAFTTANDPAFLAHLEPGEILLVGPGSQALPDGIAAAEDSFWAHAFIFIGNGQVIEAEGAGIQQNDMSKYLGSDTQLVGYSMQLTDAQLSTILTWLKAQVGKPYGYLTFLTELFPNPSDIPVSDPGWICSGLCATAYKQAGITVVNQGVNPAQASPKDLNDYLEPNLAFMQTRYNW
jgi:uncharacterized protein YycO